ncbi:MAG TPA: hypothetical protein VIN75_18885 [Burkholderiaceae bacterium]
MASSPQAHAGAPDLSNPAPAHTLAKPLTTSEPVARPRIRKLSHASSLRVGKFNILGMAVEVMQVSSRDVDAGQSGRG